MENQWGYQVVSLDVEDVNNMTKSEKLNLFKNLKCYVMVGENTCLGFTATAYSYCV